MAQTAAHLVGHVIPRVPVRRRLALHVGPEPPVLRRYVVDAIVAPGGQGL